MAVHRPTLFNLMNSIVGVSVLSIPFCFYQCGVVLGSLAMLVMMYFTKKTCSFLLVSSQIARRRSYESLAQYTYGNTGKLGVEACIIGLTFGTLCAFNVIIGDLGPSIIHNVFSVQITPSIRAIIMMALAYGIGLPLSLMRDISGLSSTSALSIMFYTFFVVQVTLQSLPHFLAWEWMKKINFWRPSGLLQSLPIFSLSFSCQPQLFGLYDSIPDPSIKKMESVVGLGMHIVSVVYLGVGFFSYVSFYDVGISGDILTNYGSSLIAELLKIGFSMSVIVSFPLMVFPMRASINSLLFPSQTVGTENMPGGPGYMPQNRFVYITVTVITMALMVGVLIPQIEVVLGLTGATMGILITMILPASMFLHAVQETKGELRNVAKVVLVVGFMFLVGSTYSVLSSSKSNHHDNKPLLPSPPLIKPTLERKGLDMKPVMKNLPTTKLTKATPTTTIATSQPPNPGKAADSKETKEKDNVTGEKRKEPALPHPPDAKADLGPLVKEAEDTKGKDQFIAVDKLPKGMDKAGKGADPLNEKRQLMSTDEKKQDNDPVTPQASNPKVDSNLDAEKSTPQASNPKVDSNLDAEKSTMKQQGVSDSSVNNSQGLGSEDKVKPESRERRHIDDSLKENLTENEVSKNDGTSVSSTAVKPSLPLSVTPESSNVVIIKPTVASAASSANKPQASETNTIEGSSVEPNSDTGEGVKSRGLKFHKVLIRSKMESAMDALRTQNKQTGRAGDKKVVMS